MKNISTPRFCIANIRADGEKAESARHLNRARQRNRERSGTERGSGTEKGAEQGKAAEAPHGRTKKSLKPDWEEAGAGTAAEAYPKQYNHDNDK